ncbi:hypothetical protein OK015_28775 (plasmid) [Mycobacterium sp. Aquia_216]|uniref:hypothetical protein n=1 Tax=Mycobacterium sp. Aquia_216 TaxID=2991729 RepID=UPI00227A0238|nr:hypothetical protein [Mycobacterium sp. Aquia_216]WAJ47948.1 hypothetical protein OK015_28775 [Mycobacterium sp. Aquia_216]
MTGSCPHLLAESLSLPQGMPALPPAREFLTSAGFGGLAALLAAVIVAAVLVFAVRSAAKRHQTLTEQQERHHEGVHQDELRAQRLRECRERLAWVVDKGGIEPAANEGATVGFGPELALTVLQGIHDDAEKLGDATLAKAAAVQLSQLSRVLAKQSGAPATFGSVDAAATDAAPLAPPESNGAPDADAGVSEESNAPAPKVPTSGRRRRP